MTDIALNTKQKPSIGSKSSSPKMQALAPMYPPKQSEPTSPINILALLVLNIKKPSIAPANNIDSTFILLIFVMIAPASPAL